MLKFFLIGISLIALGLDSVTTLVADDLTTTSPNQPLPVESKAIKTNLAPSFWVGAVATQILGYSFDTQKAGLKPGSDNWANVQFGFAQSKYDVTKYYETGADPSQWSGHIQLRNVTLNNADGTLLSVVPEWLAEIQGQGFHATLYNNLNGPDGKPVFLVAADQVDPLIPPSGAPVLTKVDTAYTGVVAGTTLSYKIADLIDFGVELGSEKAFDTPGTSGTAFGAYLDSTPLGVSGLYPRIVGNLVGGTQFAKNPVGFGASSQLVIPLPSFADSLVSTLSVDGLFLESGAQYFEYGVDLTLNFTPKVTLVDAYSEKNSLQAKSYNNIGSIKKATRVGLVSTMSLVSGVDLGVVAENVADKVSALSNLAFFLQANLDNVDQGVTGWSLASRLGYKLAADTMVPYVYSSYSSTLSQLRFQAGVELSLIPLATFNAYYTTDQALSGSGIGQKLGTLALQVQVSTDGRKTTPYYAKPF